MTDFDVLTALSEARTALDDPGALTDAQRGDDPFSAVDYAVERIDMALGALSFESANDYRGEARWTLTHLRRLLHEVAETLAADAHHGGAEADDYDTLVHAANDLGVAGDLIDSAIERL